MPGIEDVDRQFRPASNGGPEPNRYNPEVTRLAEEWRSTEAQRRLSEAESAATRKATPEESAALARMRDLVCAEDRREVRRQALTLAVQTMGNFEADGASIEALGNDALELAGRFERYLLGEADDPSVPKPPAKME